MSFLKHKMEQHITETADGEYTFGRENVFTETTSDRVVKKENGDKYVDIGLHGEKPYGIHELQYAVTQNPFLGSDYHIERGEEIAFAKNLNKYVDVDDHFIFLGDFDSRHSTPDFDRLKRFFANIKCRNVYLILGNNDSFPVKKYKELGIKAVVDKFEFGNCILTHFPVMVKAPMINIHGHLHGAASPTQKGEKAYWYADPKRCVDVWRDDFSPVRLNDVLSNWKEMQKYKSYNDGKMRLLSEDKDGDEHMYFYHLVPKGSDVSGGIKSLDWFYKHDKKLFLKYSEKYRDRLVNAWGIYSNTSPEKLTAKMIYDGINKFRGTKDGCNQIYCFYYPPHRYLGEKMRKLLETKDIYRIDIKSDELKNCLKSIDWGYEGSFTGNKKLSENWYKNCTYDDYFSKYDENVTPLFSTLNHISICTKDGLIPEKCLIKIENPEMVLTTESGDDLSNIPEEIVKFNKELCKWDYGVILNGKKYTNSNEIDWSKYKTTPINIIEKEHVGICWDFVNYQHHYFKDNKIHDESYFYVQQVSDNENDIVTHTFSVITISGTKYWFEAAWGGHKGIHKISSWKDTINVLCEKYNKDKKFPYSVFKYNPDGLDKNIPNSVFFEKATQNLVYDYKGTYTESGDDVFEESVGSYQTKELTRDFIEKFKKNMKALSHIRTNENTKGVMLVDGENCIGFINTEVKDDGVWIQALEVSKEYQHQGYGQKLLEYGIKKLKATKLSVRKSNSHAIKLYKKNGFSVVDENDYQYIMSLGKTYQESGDDVFEESLETFLTTNPFEKEVTLYHGSTGKYDVIKPLRINVGTRVSNPRNSSFWGTDYKWCKVYALQKLLSENGCVSLLNTVMKSICPKDDVDDDLIAKESDKNKIDKILRSGQIYLYTKKMPKKYLGIGHNASYPEFSIDFPVKPDNVEILSYKDFGDISIKYVTDDAYENKYVAMIKEVVAKNKKFGHGKWLKYTDNQRTKIRNELKSYKEFTEELFEESMSEDITTIIFDFGGVLIDSHAKEKFKALNLPEEDVFEITETLNTINSDIEYIPYKDALSKFYKSLSDEFKKKYSFKKIQKIFDIQMDCKVPSAYTDSLLKGLKKKGYRLLYLTNRKKCAQELINKQGLLKFVKYFEGGIVSADVGMRKPNPEIWKMLISEYNLIPEECLFVDDKEKNCLVANSLGMKYEIFDRVKSVKKLKKLPKIGKVYKESVDENQFQFIDFKNPKAKSYLEEGEKSYWNEYGDWHIKNSIGEIVIDKENDKLAGYIFVDNKASGQEGFITPLMVIKRYRKNGLGNRLLEDAISKYHAIDLVVKKSNTIALNMYKKHGFVTIGKGNEKGTIYMKLKSKLGKDDQIIEESCKSLKEARDAVAKWERDNGYNDKEDWSDNLDDTSDYMLKEESSDEVLTENVMISRNDIYYGFDKFESGEKNVLLITGFSGSGKSTLAENLSSKYDCDYFMIDSLEFYAGGYMSLDNLKKGEPGCYEFLMKHPKFKETLERDYSGKEYWNILCQYIPWLISWCKKKKPEKFIIEGLQLYETLSEGSVPDTILSNPFIIKGTSGLKSAWRAGKRAGGKELPAEFVRQLKWAFKDNKQLEQLKKALDKEYGESSDEVLSGEVVTEEANYNKRNIYPVYIILTDADSPMAKLIKSYTGQPYAHALISFNTDLEPAYSFGCTSIKPLKFGFISKSEEDPFRNEEKAAYVVYVMYVNKMQYTKIQDKLQWFMDNKDKMKYSWGGLIALGLHIPKQFENQYFCSQFVMDLIGDAIKLPKDPSLWTPGDIEHLQNISLVDKGPDLRYFNKKRFKRNLKYIQKHQFNKMKYESTLGNPNTVVFDFGSVLVKNTSLDAFYKANISESKAKILAKAYFEFIHIDENLPVDKAIELYRKTLPKDLQVYAKTAFRICATSKEKYDYTIPLLKFLKSRGYKLYYLSNWARSGFTLMKQSHIMDFVTLFDGGIVSYEVGLKKPDPNIYKLLITKYDLDPKDCIFYDDKKENCDAARKIGMKAVQFTQDTVKEIMKSPSVINESVDLFSEATDSITNPNLSHYFVEKVGKRVDKVLSDPAKVKEFNNLVRNYINRNITKLTKSGPCDMIPFTDLDHKQFQEMFGFWYNITKTKETSPNEIREYITEYSKLAHAKITFWLNNSSQVLFYFVIRYFTMHPDPKSLNAALSIYTLCIYPVMFHKYFPLGVMEPIMQYTIDNLTEKFLIKKSKHLFDSLLQSIQASYRFHKNNFKNASDKNVADWISRIRNDQNSMLKKISNEYMKNWKDGKAARTTNEEYDSDTPIIDELENGTTAVQNIVQKVTLPIIEEGVDLVRAEAAAKMAQVSISDCRYFLTLIITDSNADLIQKFIESILFLYIYEGKKTERDIRSTYFITWAASLFKKTNSKNPNINTINGILNTWSENSGINKKFSRIASRINYKKAIFYYLILCIQKHV